MVMIAGRKGASLVPPSDMKSLKIDIESSSESYASIASSDDDESEEEDDNDDEDKDDNEDEDGNKKEEDEVDENDKMKKEESMDVVKETSSSKEEESSIVMKEEEKTKEGINKPPHHAALQNGKEKSGKDNDTQMTDTLKGNKSILLQNDENDTSEETILKEYNTMSNTVRDGLLCLAGIENVKTNGTKSINKNEIRKSKKSENNTKGSEGEIPNGRRQSKERNSDTTKKARTFDKSSDGKKSQTVLKRNREESQESTAIQPSSSSSPPRKKVKSKDYTTLDVMLLRKNAEVLMKKARAMKHAGDKADKAENHSRGLYYLQSALHFFEYALLLDDIKLTYRAQSDASRSKIYGNQAFQMLPQTASLIDVAARNFKSDLKWIAICHKFAAFVHMYIFKVQRIKLSAIHTELQQASVSAKVLGSSGPCQLPTPVSSPCLSTGSSPLLPSSATQNGVVGSLSNDYYMKEMGNLFKAFELWSRYERYDHTVLPELKDFATANMEEVVKCVEAVLEANLPRE